jgi:NADP-dependent 3-hydroxy acid dehydrogenase YdfG
MLASIMTKNEDVPENEDIPYLVTEDVATTVLFVLSMPQHVQV